jgi:hypothetical protein
VPLANRDLLKAKLQKDKFMTKPLSEIVANETEVRGSCLCTVAGNSVKHNCMWRLPLVLLHSAPQCPPKGASLNAKHAGSSMLWLTSTACERPCMAACRIMMFLQRITPSYVKMPPGYPRLTHSGRTPLGNEVLNDQYVNVITGRYGSQRCWGVAYCSGALGE